MRSYGRRVTSTSRSGVATPSFIRSTRFVPPPRKTRVGDRAVSVRDRAAASSARS